MRPFLRVNVVGVVGFAVQLGALAAFTAIGVPVVPATCLAVETAVLHNFTWHERWTWAGIGEGTRASRLARFHVSNGLISLAGNAAITTALVHSGAPLLLANIAAVLTCALVNFATANVWVFSHPTAHRNARSGPRLC